MEDRLKESNFDVKEFKGNNKADSKNKNAKDIRDYCNKVTKELRKKTKVISYDIQKREGLADIRCIEIRNDTECHRCKRDIKKGDIAIMAFKEDIPSYKDKDRTFDRVYTCKHCISKVIRDAIDMQYNGVEAGYLLDY